MKATTSQIYPLNQDKRFLIHKLRQCPACGAYAAKVKKTDKEGKPVLGCSVCGAMTACEYGK